MKPSVTYVSLLIINLFFLLFSGQISAQTTASEGSFEECTIGVAAGKATSNNRPLLWKTRDNSSAQNNNLVFTLNT